MTFAGSRIAGQRDRNTGLSFTVVFLFKCAKSATPARAISLKRKEFNVFFAWLQSGFFWSFLAFCGTLAGPYGAIPARKKPGLARVSFRCFDSLRNSPLDSQA
jgi:hypothetical protein